MGGVLVLGGSGRTGRAVADVVRGSGLTPILVGRDRGRLEAASARRHQILVVPSATAMAAAIRSVGPRVVVNTVGPFTATANIIVDACLESGADYVDIANDMASVPRLLGRGGDAERAGRTLVTGAGFGVTATESVVVWLCTGVSPAERVRVDMVPSLEVHAGVLGESLAQTLVDGLPQVPGGGRFQGRRIDSRRLVAAPIGGRPRALVTPDGDRVSTALMPLGELIAAQRASGASFVEAGSSEVPSGRLARAVIPVGTRLLGVSPLRRLVARRLAAVRLKDRPAPRQHSWGHADVRWSDGTRAEGWLRLPEAHVATVAIVAETTRRLAHGEGRPGAFTPAALFGTDLVTSIGGHFIEVESGRVLHER